MNKAYIDSKLPIAVEAIKAAGISNKNNEVEKNFRGQIASFGAAVTMGSFEAAVAFFSDDGGSEVSRSKLICALYHVVTGEKATDAKEVCRKIINHTDIRLTKANFLNASIAVKLAMNCFTLT